MNIGIDLDEVLGDFVGAYLQFYNNKHNTRTSAWRREEFHSFNFWEVVGGTKEEQQTLFAAFAKTEHFLRMQPFDDAIAALKALKDEHTLVLITARPKEIEEQTLHWLEEHFPGVFTRVHMTNQFAQEGFWRSKAQVCQEEHIDLMIEDNLDYARECASAGTQTLLFDAPWNQSATLPKEIVRVYNWKEIVEIISQTSP